jgi:hypothetical protein
MRGMADGPVQMVKMWAKPCAMGAIYFPAWPTHGPTCLIGVKRFRTTAVSICGRD